MCSWAVIDIVWSKRSLLKWQYNPCITHRTLATVIDSDLQRGHECAKVAVPSYNKSRLPGLLSETTLRRGPLFVPLAPVASIIFAPTLLVYARPSTQRRWHLKRMQSATSMEQWDLPAIKTFVRVVLLCSIGASGRGRRSRCSQSSRSSRSSSNSRSRRSRSRTSRTSHSSIVSSNAIIWNSASSSDTNSNSLHDACHHIFS